MDSENNLELERLKEVNRLLNNKLNEYGKKIKQLENTQSQALDPHKSYFADKVALIFWIELKNPVSINQPVEDQVDEIFKEAYIKDISELAVKIFGYKSKEELIGCPITDLWLEGSYQRGSVNHDKYINLLNEGYHVNQKVIKSITRLGEEKWFLTSTRFFIENDCIARIWTSQIDVTQQKITEKKAIQLHSAIEQSHDLVIITDIYDRIVYTNPAYMRMTGYSMEELTGENPGIVRSDYTPNEAYDLLWDTISSGGTYIGTFKNKKKNGEFYWVSATFSPVISPSGKIINYLSIQKDITEEREKENLLRQSQKMEAIGRLVAGITHDFKNIMSVITLNADFLMMSLPENDELKLDVVEIQRSVKLANSITQQLLTFCKEQKTDFEKFNPYELLSKLHNWFDRLVGAEIKLSFEIKNKEMRINANPSMLEQVIINLITNAKDAMPRGGEISLIIDKISITNNKFECDIEIEHTNTYLGKEIENGEYFNLHVKDTGVGMDEETIKYILQSYTYSSYNEN